MVACHSVQVFTSWHFDVWWHNQILLGEMTQKVQTVTRKSHSKPWQQGLLSCMSPESITFWHVIRILCSDAWNTAIRIVCRCLARIRCRSAWTVATSNCFQVLHQDWFSNTSRIAAKITAGTWLELFLQQCLGRSYQAVPRMIYSNAWNTQPPSTYKGSLR